MKGRKKKPEADKDILERDFETVMFVPFTEGSRLQKLLQSSDNEFISKGNNKRIKFVERGGTTLEQVLGRSDPWGSRGCPRTSCFQCQHGGGEGGEIGERGREGGSEGKVEWGVRKRGG